MNIVKRKVEREPLTKRQKEVYDYIVECGEFSPTWEQIGRRFGRTTHSTWHYIKTLKDKGWIGVERCKRIKIL